MTFTDQSMLEIMTTMRQHLSTNSSFTFTTLNPDLYEEYAGTTVELDGKKYIYRGLKSWFDLSEALECKVNVPNKVTDHFIELTFTKLNKQESFHDAKVLNKSEKYGIESHFFKINKMEEPSFLFYYKQALENVNVFKRTKVLNLGVNRADEFSVIKDIDDNSFKSLQLVGVDHSKSALEYAQGQFSDNNVKFYESDLNEIDKLNLRRFDLLISIGTLQSPSINFKPYFMKLVQEYLEKDSAIILGFPNSRWIGSEMIYGAKAPNYAMSEMSLMFNDVIFVKKYLQQHKFRVTITGKHYIFVTATKIL